MFSRSVLAAEMKTSENRDGVVDIGEERLVGWPVGEGVRGQTNIKPHYCGVMENVCTLRSI